MKNYKNAMIASSLLAVAFVAGASSAVVKQGKRVVINLNGTGEMYLALVPDVDGDGQEDQAMCFDVDAIDLNKDQVVGTGTDCLIVMSEPDEPLSVLGTTYFDLQGGNSIVTRGLTSVQPKTGALGGFTHVTGATPSGGNDILDGTGVYAGKTGSARLSGLVNLGSFNGNEGETITFDCLFVIDLD